jgi:hypothetical protein
MAKALPYNLLIIDAENINKILLTFGIKFQKPLLQYLITTMELHQNPR